MSESIVRLKVEDSSFNAKIKEAARSFADFGKRVASAGSEALGDFARGVKNAKTAFEGFNAALKANALVLVASLAIQAASAIGEMIGNWITGADDAADAQQRLNDKLEETAQAIERIKDEGDFNARLAKAAGASTSQVLQMKVDSAREAYNKAMATLFDQNIKVGTEEYDKAKKIYDQAEKRLQKALQEQKIDEVAKANRTGEYAAKGGGGGRTKTAPTYAPGSIAEQQALVSSLTKDWNNAGASVRDSYLQPLIEAEAKLKQMKDDMQMMKDQAALKDSIAFPIDEAAKAAVKKADSWHALEDITPFEGFKGPLDELEDRLQELTNLQKTFGSVSAEAWQGYQQEIDATNKKIAEFKGTKPTENLQKDATATAQSYMYAASAINQVGSALNHIEDPAAKVMGIVAQAIATVAQAYAGALSSDSTTKSNIWAFIAAAASATASMVTTIASIHQATGYASGGEVKGNTYSNDQIPAMLNAGEIVLTRAMAGNLASQLQGNGLANLGLTATIKGEDIRLAINNNGRRTGRGEYVTTRFR